MKILVMVEDYSHPSGKKAMHYVHTRNKYYLQKGIKVDVISFRAKKSYTYENINVCTKEYLEEVSSNKFEDYNVIISHAPNLKHHFKYLYRIKDWENVVLFFHGHEIMNYYSHYPQPYKRMQSRFENILKIAVRKIYDFFKLKLWHYSIKYFFKKFTLVFVSEWLYETFKNDTGLLEKEISQDVHVIPNVLGQEFQKKINLKPTKHSAYDVVTFRTNMDSPKYGIDLIVEMARLNPNLKFDVFAFSKYFNYYAKPDNLTLHQENLNHKEIIKVLTEAKCVYLPTRLDAQGVLACEVASTGFPMIVSDIPIMREMLGSYKNVLFMKNNELKEIDLNQIMDCASTKSISIFSEKNTIEKEVDLIKELGQKGG